MPPRPPPIVRTVFHVEHGLIVRTIVGSLERGSDVQKAKIRGSPVFLAIGNASEPSAQVIDNAQSSGVVKWTLAGTYYAVIITKIMIWWAGVPSRVSRSRQWNPRSGKARDPGQPDIPFFSPPTLHCRAVRVQTYNRRPLCRKAFLAAQSLRASHRGTSGYIGHFEAHR